MGISTAWVRLSDGTVKYTTYQNTSDILRPLIYDRMRTHEEAYGHVWPDPDDLCDCVVEPVQVWVDYADGFGWEAKGCVHRVHGPHEPIYEEVDEVLEPWQWVRDAGWRQL